MLLTLFAWMLVVQVGSDVAALPSVDEVIAKLVQRDQDRRSASQGYTSVRQYVLENSKYHKEAYMIVRMTQCKDGSKEFKILTSSGWSGALNHVFAKLLKAEADASRPGNPEEDSRVTPQNYSFLMLRTEEVDGRKAYVIRVIPKKEKQYLVRGTIWVDAKDLAIIRIEGAPAKSPSFWIKSVRFAHTYEKHDKFWLAASAHSVSDAWFFGPTKLRIDYFDYSLNKPGQEAKLR
jgi:hypothetical protein